MAFLGLVMLWLETFAAKNGFILDSFKKDESIIFAHVRKLCNKGIKMTKSNLLAIFNNSLAFIPRVSI